MRPILSVTTSSQSCSLQPRSWVPAYAYRTLSAGPAARSALQQVWNGTQPQCQHSQPSSNRRPSRLCAAASSSGQGRQFETELFRKLFGAPPPPKQDNAGGGGDKPPREGPDVYEEEEEPDEEQVRLAKLRGRQQALFNCISILLLLGLVSAASIWKPHFLYLGRVWRIVRVDSKMQSYAELGSEGLVWGLLLSMGWPWNLLIYPVHLTRKELTNARKGSRAPSARNIKNSVWNPFARKPRPQPVQPQIV